MKVLIIGGNSAAAKASLPILSKKFDVVTAGRSNCDIYCDVTKNIELPKDIDVVANFAATFGGDSDKDIILAEKTNALGALNVCVAARQAGVKHIINISSLSATHKKGSAYHTIYAVTKKNGDDLMDLYCDQHNIRLTILRPSQIFGDDNSFKKHQPFFSDLVEKASKGEDIYIYGSHDPLRNYIHVEDLAQMISSVIENSITGIYPCIYPKDVTFSEIAKVAQDTFGKGGDVKFMKDKPDIPDNVFTHDNNVYKKIGYKPKISLEEGMKRIKKLMEVT